jgi:hypothetical protein
MKFQRQFMLSSGSHWHEETDPTRINEFIDMALELESLYAPHLKRAPMTTREQVLEFLATGETLKYDNEIWYAQIRDGDAPRWQPRVKPPVRMTKADCGHTIPASWMMNASMGTSCPECYERMSD